MNPGQVVDHLVDHGLLDRRRCFGNFLRRNICTLAGQFFPFRGPFLTDVLKLGLDFSPFCGGLGLGIRFGL